MFGCSDVPTRNPSPRTGVDRAYVDSVSFLRSLGPFARLVLVGGFEPPGLWNVYMVLIVV